MLEFATHRLCNGVPLDQRAAVLQPPKPIIIGNTVPLVAKPAKPSRDEDVMLVLMPTRGTMAIETAQALFMHMDGFQTSFIDVSRRDVSVARNKLVTIAKEAVSDNKFPFTPREWFCLWVDSDAWWPPGTVAAMHGWMRANPSADVLFGSFCPREPFCPPLGFYENNRPIDEYNLGDVVEVVRCGMHFAMHRVTLLDRLGEDPFTIPPDTICGEDFAFCDRVRMQGGKSYVATAAKVAHIDPNDGAAYIPNAQTLRIENGKLTKISKEHFGIKIPEERSYGEDVDAARDAALQTNSRLNKAS